MSNVDVLSRCIDAISAQDADTLHALAADDVEIYPLRAVIDDTVYRGQEGVDQWLRDLRDSWAEMRFDIHDIAETEADYVVAKVTLRNRGNASDVPTEMPVELHARLRDGVVTCARVVTADS